MISIPEELQNKIMKFEQMRQQLQIISSQRMQMDDEAKESRDVLEILESMEKESSVYRRVGGIMVKIDDVEALKNEIQERQETIEIRLKSFQKQEETMKTGIEELQQEIAEDMNRMQSSGKLDLSGLRKGG